MVKVVKCRANGGYLVHLVNRETAVALCGHKPRNTGRLFRRAKWYLANEESTRYCKKCRNRMGEEVQIVTAAG